MNNLPPTNSLNLDSQRWQRIEEIFQQANSLPPQTRAEFLAQACGEDAVLRHEVESLLAVSAEASRYFDPDYLSQASQSFKPNFPPIKTPAPLTHRIALNWFQRVSLIIITLTLVVYGVLCWLNLKYLTTAIGGMEIQIKRNQAVVDAILPGSPADGRLRPGDIIIAINGERQFAQLRPHVTIRRIRPPENLDILVKRENQELFFSLSATPFPFYNTAKLHLFIGFWTQGLGFLILAILLTFSQIQVSITRLAILDCWIISVVCMRFMLMPIESRLNEWEQWLDLAEIVYGNLIFVALGFHWGMYFPPKANISVSTIARRACLFLYLGCLFLAIPAIFMGLANKFNWAAQVLFSCDALLFRLHNLIAPPFFVFGQTCTFLLHISNYRKIKDSPEKHRLRVIFIGTLLGIFGSGLRQVIDSSYSFSLLNTSYTGLYISLNIFSYLFSLSFPFTIGYAIFTQQFYDVRLVIRRGLQYLLARNVLRVALALPIFLAIWQIASQPDQTVRQLILGQPLTLILIALAALSLAFRQQLSRWLDQRFFREQYQQEQVLYRLIDEIGEYDNLQALCLRVEQVLAETLHPQRVSFFLRQTPNRALQLVQTDNRPAQTNAGNGSISEASALYQLLKNTNEPLAFPLPRGAAALPPDEQRQLALWQTHLLVPLHDSQAQLAGVLLLGEKRSEEPYSSTDRRLLAALAQQMATVVEVAQLRGQVVQQAQTEHAVLARLAADEINLLRECPQCGACYGAEAKQCANCNTALALTMPIERVIEGRYQLEQLIGKGGMGVVYRADDQRLRRAVAVKILKAEYFGDPALLRRFEKEALAIARLDHPNIVRVYDSGVTKAGGAWLVMELLTGINLREALQRRGQGSLSEISHWFTQLLDALQVAHQAGVVHRDLKPENILLLTETPLLELSHCQIKVLDFGLAKLQNSLTESQVMSATTLAGMLVGTFAYMAPEQFEGKAVDVRADIYSLTLILAESLTGYRPSAHSDVTSRSEFYEQRLPAECRAFTPLLRQGLHADVAQRYTSVAALRADFFALASQINSI